MQNLIHFVHHKNIPSTYFVDFSFFQTKEYGLKNLNQIFKHKKRNLLLCLSSKLKIICQLFLYFFKDVIEEEEAFQAYAEQRRYASTLGRACLGSGTGSGGSQTGTATRGRRDNADGKSSTLKGNISRLVCLHDLSNNF